MDDTHASSEAAVPSRADALLEQSAWLGALARSLVRDDATAQDVVQETWLAALAHAPREHGRLKPWLARVLANAARKHGRSETRRANRERVAARPERLPSSDDLAERFETQRTLLAALEELEEPFRRALVLRYLDGLEPAEIARREAIPAGTARWRIHEGLERMRKKLDRRFGGDRGAWALLCVPLTRAPSLQSLAALGTTTTIGAFALSTSTRVAAAAILLSIGIGGAWWWSRASQRVDAGSAAEVASRALAPRAESLPPVAPVTDEPTAPRATSVSTIAPSATSSASATTTVEGRFVDEARRPIGAVRAELEELAARFESDADGRFRVALPHFDQRRSDELIASAAGRVRLRRPLELEPDRVNELGELVLAPGARIFGSLRDRDGNPIADARVVVVRAESIRNLELVVTSGPEDSRGARTVASESTSGVDGAWELDGAPATVVRVLAGGGERRWSVSPPIDLFAGERRGPIDLVLESLAAHDRIAGIVLDPNGAAVPNAEVCWWYQATRHSEGGQVDTDANGRFSLTLSADAPHDLSARDKLGRYAAIVRERVPPGTLDCTFRFVPARTCELHVIDATGIDVPAFQLEVRGVVAEARFGWQAQTQDAPGRKRFVVPTESFRIVVEAPRFAKSVLGPLEPANVGATLECELRELAGVRGRVFADGAPVAGARVFLQRHLAPGERREVDGFRSRLEPIDLEPVTTGADGAFVLTPRVAARFVLVAERDGFARTERDLGEIDPERGIADLQLALVRGGAIEGRVLVGGGRSAAGTIVAFDRQDGHPRSVRADREGRFRVEHLTPGPWLVRRIDRDLSSTFRYGSFSSGSNGSSDDENFPSTCDVVEGGTTRFDLDVRDEASALLDVELSLDGAPAIGWRVAAWPASAVGRPASAAAGSTDAHGALRLDVGAIGSHHIELSPPFELASDVQIVSVRTLSAGRNALVAAFQSASVRGTWRDAPSRRRVDVRWNGADGWSSRGSCTVDEDGAFRVPLALAGELELEARDLTATWLTVARRTLTLRAGDSATVDVP